MKQSDFIHTEAEAALRPKGNMNKLKFTLLILVVIPVVMHATITIDGITYQSEGMAARVTHVESQALTQGVLFVPAYIEYTGKVYEVREIGAGACTACPNLEMVVLPDGVVKIDSLAFSGCRDLRTVLLPSGLREIGESVFDGCESLNTIYLPEALNSIGTRAFHNCRNLQAIYIPSSVTEMRHEVFAGCDALSHVTLPYSEQYVDLNLFGETTSLISLVLYVRKDTPVLKRLNVEWWSKITSVYIESGVTGVGEKAFLNHKCLKTLYIPNSVTEFGKGALYRCDSVTVYTTAPKDIVEKAFYKGDWAWGSPQKIAEYNREIAKNRVNVVLTTAWSYYKPFSYYAMPTLTRQIVEWASQQEGERMVQWKQRVTEAQIKAKAEEFETAITDDFLSKRLPNYTPNIELVNDSYDAEEQYFLLYDKELGEVKLHVSNERAEYVETNWDIKKMKIVYLPCIKDELVQFKMLEITMLNGEKFSMK
ncbi:MAG: leucine-rich repeat domain-containing protein [Paludibacteraceae bacterium]|nr:leucine-rich repeat domain-containing protein [Paludibacteraceae bacterium]